MSILKRKQPERALPIKFAVSGLPDFVNTATAGVVTVDDINRDIATELAFEVVTNETDVIEVVAAVIVSQLPGIPYYTVPLQQQLLGNPTDTWLVVDSIGDRHIEIDTAKTMKKLAKIARKAVAEIKEEAKERVEAVEEAFDSGEMLLL